MLGTPGEQPEKPLAYAIIDNKSEQEVEYFRRHEGVQMLSFATKDHGYGCADRILYELKKATSFGLQFGKHLSSADVIWLHGREGSEEDLQFRQQYRQAQEELTAHEPSLEGIGTFVDTTQVNEARHAVKKAFDKCHLHKRLPIVITSLSNPIPDSDGVEFLGIVTQLASEYGQSAFKIIFDSSDPDLQQSANKIGANAFCTSADMLVNTIDSYLMRMSGWTPHRPWHQPA